MEELIAAGTHQVAELISLVCQSVKSKSSKRLYRSAIREFLVWCSRTAQPAFNKAAVQKYRAELEARALAPATINVYLAAIRKLAAEAADNGLLSPDIAAGILRVKGSRRQGVRTGNWLTKVQAERLLQAPDTRELRGLRDRALLAVLLGTGLRRREAAELTFEKIQQRDGRWVFVDLVGKGEKPRTVPVPTWCKAALDHWSQAAGISTGCVFRPINRAGKICGSALSAQSVFNIVRSHAEAIQKVIAPHDLRRTFAKLAYSGNAPLDQIQLSLGHASLQTTERYLGIRQNLMDAPCDHLGLRVPADPVREPTPSPPS